MRTWRRLGHGPAPGRILAAVVAVAVVLGAADCAKPLSATPRSATRSSATLPPGARSSATRPSGVSAAFDATDRAWIEITIAMDEQVRPLLDLVPGRYADRTVPALAGQVRAIIDTELPTLRLLHDQADLPAQNPHAGMLMPGLVTADQVARAATLRGAEFDAFAVATLREYLAHGADLARSETKNGQESRTKALATTAIGTRTHAVSGLSPPP
ncbi:DUF305 domain-containing protein [Rugosimonospora africana]|uniref:DUF305 domain-containing protein n=1 Tax=Rugosimonospora africana TaxID=556532 RepID=A0A8J3QYQ8_9ACTN|nr:DUF305 domain-containing protein [Rugosimonospora africana]GIH19714.1 hypothetical protein Raf01_78860 [Rugosimonospora africana]